MISQEMQAAIDAAVSAAVAEQTAELRQQLARAEQKLADVTSHIKALHENQQPDKVNDTLRSYVKDAFEVKSAEVYTIDYRTKDKSFFTTCDGRMQYLDSSQDAGVHSKIKRAIESGEPHINSGSSDSQSSQPYTLLPIKNDIPKVVSVIKVDKALENTEIEQFNSDRGAAQLFKLGLENAHNYVIARTQDVSGGENRLAMREYFERDVPKTLEAKQNVFYIAADIDNFKKFNNDYNHQTGDSAIRTVCETFKKNCRGNDRIFNVGGDEFYFVLSGCSAEDAAKFSDKMCEAVANTRVQIIDEHGNPKTDSKTGEPVTESVTVSMGISQVQLGIYKKVDIEAARKEADAQADAMAHAAKALGRNCAVPYPKLCSDRDNKIMTGIAALAGESTKQETVEYKKACNEVYGDDSPFIGRQFDDEQKTEIQVKSGKSSDIIGKSIDLSSKEPDVIYDEISYIRAKAAGEDVRKPTQIEWEAVAAELAYESVKERAARGLSVTDADTEPPSGKWITDDAVAKDIDKAIAAIKAEHSDPRMLSDFDVMNYRNAAKETVKESVKLEVDYSQLYSKPETKSDSVSPCVNAESAPVKSELPKADVPVATLISNTQPTVASVSVNIANKAKEYNYAERFVQDRLSSSGGVADGVTDRQPGD